MAVLFAPVLETLEDVLLDGVFLVSDVAIVFLHIARRRAVLVFRHAERRGIESGRERRREGEAIGSGWARIDRIGGKEEGSKRGEVEHRSDRRGGGGMK